MSVNSKRIAIHNYITFEVSVNSKGIAIHNYVHPVNLVLFNFFQGLSFLHLEFTLPFAKLCYAFEEKKIFLPP